MRTREELKKTHEYWVEMLENSLWRVGINRYQSTTKKIMRTTKFDVTNSEHVAKMQALLDALSNFQTERNNTLE